jgi:hypothetical protein
MLNELQCVQFVNYLVTPDNRSAIEEWQKHLPGPKGHEGSRRQRITSRGEEVIFPFTAILDDASKAEGKLSTVPLHDTLAAYREYLFSGSYPPKEVAPLCKRFLTTPHPLGDPLGKTNVLVAQLEDTLGTRQVASDLLQELTGSPPWTVRGGCVAPGVQLFSARDPEWLVLFTTKKAENEASDFLYNWLWIVEWCFHKVIGQQAEYEKRRNAEEDRSPLEGPANRLRVELDRLADVDRRLSNLEEPNDKPKPVERKKVLKEVLKQGNPAGLSKESYVIERKKILKEVLKQRAKATTAYATLIQEVEWARKLLISLEANRASMKMHLAVVEGEPGQAALAYRLRRADMAVTQVEVDLGHVQPLLEFARWLSGSHQQELLTDLQLAESDAATHREQLRHFGEGIIAWLTFIQLWALAVSTALVESHLSLTESPLNMLVFFVIMAVPAVVLGLLLLRVKPWRWGFLQKFWRWINPPVEPQE